METKSSKNTTHVLETMMEEILARLPLRSIARFKTVCKTWKSTLESPYFRRLFLSLHKNSSSSWSLLYGAKEVIGFHGCETWDLPKPRASFKKRYYFDEFYYRASSNGLVLIENYHNMCFVGNPVLQQWVSISNAPDYNIPFSLVTRSDEDGIVSSFKVFGLVSIRTLNDYLTQTWSTFVYSSETGIWTSRIIHCPHQLTDTSLRYITTNGTIYLSGFSEPARLVAYDFYSDSDQFRVVHFPDHSDTNNIYKRALTTSGGFVMHIRTCSQTEDKTFFKVWRLNNDDSWQLLWETGISIIGDYAPMVMDPFDSRTVYLWSLQDRHVVSCDLQRKNYIILRDQSVCENIINLLTDWDYSRVSTGLLQFVLPRWMEPVPCPPHAEIIYTTSLLSYINFNARDNE